MFSVVYSKLHNNLNVQLISTLSIVSGFYQGHVVLVLELIETYFLINIKIQFLTWFFNWTVEIT